MVIRHGMAWLGLLGVCLGLYATGCKNLELDVLVVENLVCEGEDCACAGTMCGCTGGTCALECPAACSYTCSSEAERCEGTAAGPLEMRCANYVSCDGTGGDASDVTCTSGADCRFEVGADSRATCDSSISTCEFTVGAGSQVDCGGANEGCDVVCAGPDCWLLCRGLCDSVTCAETGQAPMACINGIVACGDACPEI